ncbi:MAG: methylmalonyl-CoA epimerase [Candidatus Marinimicrobia bacterium]|nr:methylmalonyl-CoA epimerase [Candidatus Neomarinimicrobiota bacterium]
MKVIKISHVAVAGDHPEHARTLYEDILGLTFSGSEAVEREGVKTHFFEIGESKIEVLEPLSEDSPVGKFLSKRGSGMHHLAFEVEGLDDYILKLKAAGIKMLTEEPQAGAHGMRIIFIHPKSTGGVLIELSEQG